jgi:DNA-3-methyladenine glycosylase II
VTRTTDPAETAYAALGAEPVLARLVSVYGPPNPFEWFDGGRTGTSKFAAMVLHITGQRISAAAAFTVFDRIATAAGSIPGPDSLLTLGTARLRDLGLSEAKAHCLVELAKRQASGRIDLDNMGALSDDEVVSALTAVPGVGSWSAQAFLLRQLRRPDILPADDTGVRCAVARECGWPARPPRGGSGTCRRRGRPTAATPPPCSGDHSSHPASRRIPRPGPWPGQRPA